MRLVASTLLGLVMCVSTYAGSFIWFNGEANPVRRGPSGAPVEGHPAAPTAGCFAQLIHAGEDGAINPARDQGTGITGDDRVVATQWFGAGVFNDLDGVIGPGTTTVPAEAGQCFYVRAWSAPASTYAGGIPPSFDTEYYGDSELWTFAGGGDAPHVPICFNFGGSGFSTTRRAGADTDGDHLPDWWEFLHFRHATDANAGGDGDGDQQSNLDEFVAGTGPLDAGSVFAAQATQSDSGVTVQWPSQTDRTYTILRSTNLGQGFSAIATGIAATPPTNSYQDENAPDQGCAFYLIEVTR